MDNITPKHSCSIPVKKMAQPKKSHYSGWNVPKSRCALCTQFNGNYKMAYVPSSRVACPLSPIPSPRLTSPPSVKAARLAATREKRAKSRKQLREEFAAMRIKEARARFRLARGLAHCNATKRVYRAVHTANRALRQRLDIARIMLNIANGTPENNHVMDPAALFEY